MSEPEKSMPELPQPSPEELEKTPLRQGEELGVTPQGVLIHVPGTEFTYQLPPAIYAIWSRCNGETTVKKMAVQLSQQTEIPADRMEAIVYAILTTLAENNLITW
ncbi:MAG: PqqD family protein [archaeon GB-1867-005]|nr:PqqD family protein [Candidatus Culexmicrobium cathedralense]